MSFYKTLLMITIFLLEGSANYLDDTKLKLSYGYDIYSLDIDNERAGMLADSVRGDYEVNDLLLRSQYIGIVYDGLEVGYEHIENEDSSERRKYGYLVMDKFLGWISAFEEGHKNDFLGIKSKYSFIYENFKFGGQYVSKGINENFKLRSKKATLKRTFNLSKKNDLFFYGIGLSHERAIVPQEFKLFNKESSYFYDPLFQIDKYLIHIADIDIILPVGFIFGIDVGFGYSDITLSEDVKKKINKQGYNNLSMKSGLTQYIEFKVGYNKIIKRPSYTLDLGVLYSYSQFEELGARISEKFLWDTDLDYSRVERLQSLKFQATIIF